MVNHIHVHRANVQPIIDNAILAGQPTISNSNVNTNINVNTIGSGTGTAVGASSTANTNSGTTAISTNNPDNTSAAVAPNSPTTTVAGTTSATSDGGLLGSLLSTHSTSSASASTTHTAIGTSPGTNTNPTFVATQASVSVAGSAQSGSASVVSTIIQSLNPSSSSSPSSPPSVGNSTNPDAGPIAGGVIGGIFAVAALGMFISFLLRRRRRKQIDKEILGTDIFGGSGYRRSTIFLEEVKDDRMDSEKLIPRPPSMIEKRVGTPTIHGNFAGGPGDPSSFSGVPYGAPATYGDGGYGDSNVYEASSLGYPPQSMQRGYYPQGQQQLPYSPHNGHLQQPGYNQAYAYSQPNGGIQVPSRAHTPQVPGHQYHPQEDMALRSVSPQELPYPFSAKNTAGCVDVGHDESESSGAVSKERRQSGQSDYGHRPSEDLPAYGFELDEKKYVELDRDSKPRPDSIDVHGAAM